MEFNEVIDRRRTSREWTDRDVDFEVIKRIIGAGMKAPSWDHYRSWQFIVLHTKEEKENSDCFSMRGKEYILLWKNRDSGKIWCEEVMPCKGWGYENAITLFSKGNIRIYSSGRASCHCSA